MNKGQQSIKTINHFSSRQLVGSDNSNIFETAAFVGVLISVLLTSVQFGTSDIWNKLILVLAVCVCGVLRIFDCILRRSIGIRSDSFVLLPLIGIFCLAIIQAVPPPFSTVATSVDPHETKVFILVFGALLLAFDLLLSYSQLPNRTKLLVGVVLFIGVGSSIFGILASTIPDFHLTPVSDGINQNQGFAQFANRNHFALLIEMTVGLLLGLLLKGEYSVQHKMVGVITVCVLLYSLILSQSRGGLVGVIALMMFAVFVHVISKRGPAIHETSQVVKPWIQSKMVTRRIITALGLCGIVLCLMIVFIALVGGDSMVTRFENLKNEVEPVNQTIVNRKRIWRSTIELIKERPVFGVGFGGFAVGISPFDTSSGEIPIRQAHNEYLEILANGGIVGFVLFSIFTATVISRIFKRMRSGERSAYPRRFGATIGIFGVLVHSTVDFGLHILVNALMFMVLIVIAIVKDYRKLNQNSI